MNELTKFTNQLAKPETFDQIQIGIASPERIVQIRQNRLLALNADGKDASYADRSNVTEEITAARRIYDRHEWPVIDVTRRSIEETAAAVLDLYRQHRAGLALS